MLHVDENNRLKKQHTFLDLPKGAKWFAKGCQLTMPLGFNGHPLEGAGFSSSYTLED